MRYRNCIIGRYFWLFVYKQFINEYRSVNFEVMFRMFFIKGYKFSFWYDLNSYVGYQYKQFIYRLIVDIGLLNIGIF